jgi:hypothetical protein
VKLEAKEEVPAVEENQGNMDCSWSGRLSGVRMVMKNREHGSCQEKTKTK